MDAANGEDCTLNIVGYCLYDNETTVAGHLPDGSGGSNRLTGALSIAFGCRDCHSVIDGRINAPEITTEDKEFYMRRGMMRTMNRLIDRGLIKVAGLK